MADSNDKLRRLVSEFGRVCERTKLELNVGASSHEGSNGCGCVCETKGRTIGRIRFFN